MRKIFIVTNGQIPSWLNVQHPRIHLIPHETIFANASHLPTFSSPAIEANLHRIPGLSEHFVYLNDDVMFGRAVYPSDFHTTGNGQRVYFAWPAPDCAEGCGANWIGDGYCDIPCNCSECNWDMGDCANGTAPTGTGQTYGTWGVNQPAGADFVPHCSSGCLDTWIGDRYCDRACRNPECGMDAGDCGMDLVYQNVPGFSVSLSRLHSIQSAEDSPPTSPDTLLRVPTITAGDSKAYNHDLDLNSVMYFNLSAVVGAGASIIDAAYSEPSLVRVITISPRNSVLIVFLTPLAMRSAFNATAPYVPTTHVSPPPTTPTPTVTPVSTTTTPTTVEGTTVGSNSTSPGVPSNATSTETPVSAPTAPKNRIFITFNVRNELREVREFMFFLELFQRAPSVDTPTNATDSSSPSPVHTPTSENVVGATTRTLLSTSEVFSDEGVKNFASESDERGEESMVYAKANPRLFEKTQYRLSKQGMTKKQIEEKIVLLNRIGRDGLDILSEKDQNNVEDVLDVDLSASKGAQRHLLDHYGDSLRHVSKLLNMAFAPEARRVPAHMPHYLRKSVIERMQTLWRAEFNATSSHQTRASNDMQYAFSYMWFLMSERIPYNFTEVWNTELDMDGDGVLNSNEMRTIASTLVRSEPANPKPSARTAFMNWNNWAAGRLDDEPLEPIFRWLERCDDQWLRWKPELASSPPVPEEREVTITPQLILDAKQQLLRAEGQNVPPSNSPNLAPTEPAPITRIAQFPYERLEEYNITTFPRHWNLTKQQLLNCTWAMRPLELHFKARLRNRFEVGNADEVGFVMVQTNISESIAKLDNIRFKRNKFVCLNDNINHTSPNAKETIAAIQDLFKALYPHPSPFELPHGQTNKFLHTEDLFAARDSIRAKRRMIYILIAAVVVILLLALRFFTKRGPTSTTGSRLARAHQERPAHGLRHPEPVILARSDV